MTACRANWSGTLPQPLERAYQARLPRRRGTGSITSSGRTARSTSIRQVDFMLSYPSARRGRMIPRWLAGPGASRAMRRALSDGGSTARNDEDRRCAASAGHGSSLYAQGSSGGAGLPQELRGELRQLIRRRGWSASRRRGSGCGRRAGRPDRHGGMHRLKGSPDAGSIKAQGKCVAARAEDEAGRAPQGAF